MNFNQFKELLSNNKNMSPQVKDGILDFVSPDCPHKKIGEAYDKASGQYDNYIAGNNPLLKILKRIALGLDKEAAAEYVSITKKMLSQLKEGIVLDIPAGTGLFTFEEYAKRPDILFVAAEYSRGMLLRAQQKIKSLKAENIVLIRADVGNLPFKPETFDAVICLNGIHSFPEKEKAISQISRVLKKNQALHGSLVLKGERWLTDLMLEAAYYRLLWFTRPALSRQELIEILTKHNLKLNSFKTLSAAAVFEAVKS